MTAREAYAVVAAACLSLTACATQSGTVTSVPTATETQRETAALASETAAEIGKCVAASAAVIAREPQNTTTVPDNIADKALVECDYLLSDYESNDRALVLATDPSDGLSFAEEHARQSKIDMSQSVRRRALEIAQEERARLARQ